MANITGSTNTTWTQYSYSYTAVSTAPRLVFGFDAANNIYIALDDVSVVDTASSLVELLANPSFENSSTTATGWSTSCTTSCMGSSSAAVITSGCRTNNCLKSLCYGGGVDYIGQVFSAVVSHVYNITFWTQRVITGGAASAVILYAGII